MVVLENAEDGEDLKISFPPGYWSSNGGPLTGEYFAGGAYYFYNKDFLN